MDTKLAQKVMERHRTENGLVQIRHNQAVNKAERYRYLLVSSGVQYNDWPMQPKPQIESFYASPLARFMAARQNEFK